MDLASLNKLEITICDLKNAQNRAESGPKTNLRSQFATAKIKLVHFDVANCNLKKLFRLGFFFFQLPLDQQLRQIRHDFPRDLADYFVGH